MEYEIYDKKSNTVLEVEGDSFKEVEARMCNDEGQVFFTFNGTYEELQHVISAHSFETKEEAPVEEKEESKTYSAEDFDAGHVIVTNEEIVDDWGDVLEAGTHEVEDLSYTSNAIFINNSEDERVKVGLDKHSDKIVSHFTPKNKKYSINDFKKHNVIVTDKPITDRYGDTLLHGVHEVYDINSLSDSLYVRNHEGILVDIDFNEHSNSIIAHDKKNDIEDYKQEKIEKLKELEDGDYIEITEDIVDFDGSVINKGVHKIFSVDEISYLFESEDTLVLVYFDEHYNHLNFVEGNRLLEKQEQIEKLKQLGAGDIVRVIEDTDDGTGDIIEKGFHRVYDKLANSLIFKNKHSKYVILTYEECYECIELPNGEESINDQWLDDIKEGSYIAVNKFIEEDGDIVLPGIYQVIINGVFILRIQKNNGRMITIEKEKNEDSLAPISKDRLYRVKENTCHFFNDGEIIFKKEDDDGIYSNLSGRVQHLLDEDVTKLY